MNSGSAGKKTTFSDETNHAAVSLLPKKEDSSLGVFTLTPLALLKAVNKHAAKLNENRMLCNVVIKKDPNKGLLFDPNKGSNLGHPVGFFFCRKILPPQFFGYCPRRKSSHMMALSHSGFFLYYHYNLRGSCLWTVIQTLTETAGVLISWVFSFLPRTIPTSTDQQGGGLLSDHPHGHNHLYSQSSDWG